MQIQEVNHPKSNLDEPGSDINVSETIKPQTMKNSKSNKSVTMKKTTESPPNESVEAKTPAKPPAQADTQAPAQAPAQADTHGRVLKPAMTRRTMMNSEIQEEKYKQVSTIPDENGEFRLYRTEDSTPLEEDEHHNNNNNNFSFFQNLFERFGCWMYVLFAVFIGLIGIIVMYIKRKYLPSCHE